MKIKEFFRPTISKIILLIILLIPLWITYQLFYHSLPPSLESNTALAWIVLILVYPLILLLVGIIEIILRDLLPLPRLFRCYMGCEPIGFLGWFITIVFFIVFYYSLICLLALIYQKIKGRTKG